MSGVFFSLLASVGLTFVWLWFFVRRDRHPEPLWLLARTFGWGMFAWLVAAAFEASLGRVLNSPLPLALLLVALLTAVIEEGSKFLAASTAITEVAFDEPMDGLVYAVTAALGFALMENITYTLGFGGHAGTWHAVVATLAHALFSAPQGYALGGLVFALGARVLVARLGEVWLVRGGSWLMAGALAAIAFAPAWGWAVPACMVMGLGFYMLHNTLQTNATQMAPERRGTAVAAFACCFFLGQSVGVGVAGLVVDRAGTGWVLAAGALGLLVVAEAFNRARVRRAV